MDRPFPRPWAFALLAGLTLAAPAHAQKPRTERAITAGDLRTRLGLIADDSMLGREPGGIGDYKATEYIAAEFARLGLEPAGEHGGWFQTVPFVRLRPDSGARLMVGGKALVQGRDFLQAGRPTMPRTLRNIVAVYGGAVGDTGANLPDSLVAGHAVVLTIARDGDGSRSMRGLGGRLASRPNLARAAMVVIVGLDLLGPESVASIGAGRLTVDTTLSAAAVPMLLVSPAAAEAMLGAPLAGLAPGAAGKTLDAAVGYVRAPTPYTARNVVAVLRGSDPKLRHEYVALTAHNDHVGFDRAPVDHDSLRAFNRVVRPMGADSPTRPPTAEEAAKMRTILDSLRKVRPARRDSIRNGADDDGSGTVSILEIAERMAGERTQLRRSILFVSHTGEESGLVGSAWFIDHATVNRDSIVADIDQDMVGRGATGDLPASGPTYLEVIGARRLSREFGDQLEATNAAQPKPFVFDYEFDVPNHPLQYYCRADHYNYARDSIPAVSFSRGEHLDYHQVTDEAQYIDYDDMARVSSMVHDAAMRIANMDHRPALDAPKKDPNAVCRQ